MEISTKSIENQKKIKSFSKLLNYLNKVNILTIVFTLFLILLTICLIINPTKYINSCYNGLLIWATTVLPSLFPFFVITKLLTELKSLDNVFHKFSKITNKLFNAPPSSSYIFGMSIISGYPVGAKLICDFYENKQISTKDANKLVTFCSTSGPLFIIGTVGAIMFQSVKIGYILYGAHILSSIINGLIFRNVFKSNNEQKQNNNDKKTDYNNMLSNTMTNSISSILVVGGFIAIFFMAIDICTDLQLLYPFQKVFEWIFSGLNFSSASNSVVNGIFEVTRGCKEISNLTLPSIFKVVTACGLITFGGLCVHAQSLAFLTKCKVNIKFYFLQKITQTIIACVICFLLCLLFL